MVSEYIKEIIRFDNLDSLEAKTPPYGLDFLEAMAVSDATLVQKLGTLFINMA